MSEMCCTWLAENTGYKIYAINRHLRTIAQGCRTTLCLKKGPTSQPLCCVRLQIQICYHNLVLVANTAVTSAVTNFRCHKLIRKVNKSNNSDIENFICNQYGEKLGILNTKNIKICG